MAGSVVSFSLFCGIVLSLLLVSFTSLYLYRFVVLYPMNLSCGETGQYKAMLCDSLWLVSYCLLLLPFVFH